MDLIITSGDRIRIQRNSYPEKIFIDVQCKQDTLIASFVHTYKEVIIVTKKDNCINTLKFQDIAHYQEWISDPENIYYVDAEIIYTNAEL